MVSVARRKIDLTTKHTKHTKKKNTKNETHENGRGERPRSPAVSERLEVIGKKLKW